MTRKKKDIVKIVAIIIAISELLFILILFGYEKRSSFDYPRQMPLDFNFKAEIGNGNFVIDTYKKTLKKSIALGKDTTIDFDFPEREKEKIYKALKKIDIYKYPQNFAPTSAVQILPSCEYHLELTINGEAQEINWTENTSSETKEARNLISIFNKILDTVNKNGRVKNLPESNINSL